MIPHDRCRGGRELGALCVEIAPDGEGRVKSEKLGLFFSIDAKTEELVAEKAETGEQLRLLEHEAASRAEAERRLAEETAARQQAEAEKRQALEEVVLLRAQLRQIREGVH